MFKWVVRDLYVPNVHIGPKQVLWGPSDDLQGQNGSSWGPRSAVELHEGAQAHDMVSQPHCVEVFWTQVSAVPGAQMIPGQSVWLS